MSYIIQYNRHWEYIYKFDQYVQKLKIRFQQKYPQSNPFPKFQWQESFRDHYIRNEHDFNTHLFYIQYNLIKHGLPDDWPYVYDNAKYDDLIDEF